MKYSESICIGHQILHYLILTTPAFRSWKNLWLWPQGICSCEWLFNVTHIGTRWTRNSQLKVKLFNNRQIILCEFEKVAPPRKKSTNNGVIYHQVVVFVLTVQHWLRRNTRRTQRAKSSFPIISLDVSLNICKLCSAKPLDTDWRKRLPAPNRTVTLSWLFKLCKCSHVHERTTWHQLKSRERHSERLTRT